MRVSVLFQEVSDGRAAFQP